MQSLLIGEECSPMGGRDTGMQLAGTLADSQSIRMEYVLYE